MGVVLWRSEGECKLLEKVRTPKCHESPQVSGNEVSSKKVLKGLQA